VALQGPRGLPGGGVPQAHPVVASRGQEAPVDRRAKPSCGRRAGWAGRCPASSPRTTSLSCEP